MVLLSGKNPSSNQSLQQVIDVNDDLNSHTPLSNQIIKYNGTNVVWGDVSSSIIPTLQQVLTQGNTASTNIIINGTHTTTMSNNGISIDGQTTYSTIGANIKGLIKIESNPNTTISLSGSKGATGNVLVSGGAAGNLTWGSVGGLQSLQDVINVNDDLSGNPPSGGKVIQYDGTNVVWGDVSTPTLQKVLDTGNTAIQTITLEDASLQTTATISGSAFSISNTTGPGNKEINLSDTSITLANTASTNEEGTITIGTSPGGGTNFITASSVGLPIDGTSGSISISATPTNPVFQLSQSNTVFDETYSLVILKDSIIHDCSGVTGPFTISTTTDLTLTSTQNINLDTSGQVFINGTAYPSTPTLQAVINVSDDLSGNTPSVGQVIKYNGTNVVWGDVSTPTLQAVINVSDDLSGNNPSVGQVIKYNGTNVVWGDVSTPTLQAVINVSDDLSGNTPGSGQVIQYDGTNVVWGDVSTPTLQNVLDTGNSAISQSIILVNNFNTTTLSDTLSISYFDSFNNANTNTISNSAILVNTSDPLVGDGSVQMISIPGSTNGITASSFGLNSNPSATISMTTTPTDPFFELSQVDSLNSEYSLVISKDSITHDCSGVTGPFTISTNTDLNLASTQNINLDASGQVFINGTAYPPAIPSLSSVLTAGPTGNNGQTITLKDISYNTIYSSNAISYDGDTTTPFTINTLAEPIHLLYSPTNPGLSSYLKLSTALEIVTSTYTSLNSTQATITSPDVQFKSSAATNQFSVINDRAAVGFPAKMAFKKTAKLGQPGDVFATINYYANDASGNNKVFASQNTVIKTATGGSEDASIDFYVKKNGSDTKAFTIDGGEEQINCNLDLDMNSNNITTSTGNLTLTTAGATGATGVITFNSKTQSPTTTADTVFQTNTVNTLTHSDASGWDFQANNITTTGDISCNTLYYTNLSPSVSNPSLQSVMDVSYNLQSTAPTTNQIIQFNGTNPVWATVDLSGVLTNGNTANNSILLTDGISTNTMNKFGITVSDGIINSGFSGDTVLVQNAQPGTVATTTSLAIAANSETKCRYEDNNNQTISLSSIKSQLNQTDYSASVVDNVNGLTGTKTLITIGGAVLDTDTATNGTSTGIANRTTATNGMNQAMTFNSGSISNSTAVNVGPTVADSNVKYLDGSFDIESKATVQSGQATLSTVSKNLNNTEFSSITDIISPIAIVTNHTYTSDNTANPSVNSNYSSQINATNALGGFTYNDDPANSNITNSVLSTTTVSTASHTLTSSSASGLSIHSLKMETPVSGDALIAHTVTGASRNLAMTTPGNFLVTSDNFNVGATTTTINHTLLLDDPNTSGSITMNGSNQIAIFTNGNANATLATLSLSANSTNVGATENFISSAVPNATVASKNISLGASSGYISSQMTLNDSSPPSTYQILGEIRHYGGDYDTDPYNVKPELHLSEIATGGAGTYVRDTRYRASGITHTDNASDYTISTNKNLNLTGDNINIDSSQNLFFTSKSATATTNDVVFKTDNITTLTHSDASGWNFQANNIKTTGSITAATFIGDVSGTSTLVQVTSNNTDATYYLPFVGGTGSRTLFIDDTTGPLTYNPGTSTVSLTSNQNGYTANQSLQLINNLATAGVTGIGVPSIRFEKNGQNTSVGDVIGSQHYYAKDASGNTAEFARIEATVRNTGVNNNDGSIIFSAAIDGTMTQIFQVNGRESENNCFLPLDMNGQAIKSNTGNLTLSTTASTVSGNIILAATAVNTAGTGGTITLTSRKQATNTINDMEFQTGTTPTLTHSDASGWNFRANNIKTTGDISCNTLYYTSLNPSVSTPSLQSVLTNGNTANNSIVLTDGTDTTSLQKDRIQKQGINPLLIQSDTSSINLTSRPGSTTLPVNSLELSSGNTITLKNGNEFNGLPENIIEMTSNPGGNNNQIAMSVNNDNSSVYSRFYFGLQGSQFSICEGGGAGDGTNVWDIPASNVGNITLYRSILFTSGSVMSGRNGVLENSVINSLTSGNVDISVYKFSTIILTPTGVMTADISTPMIVGQWWGVCNKSLTQTITIRLNSVNQITIPVTTNPLVGTTIRVGAATTTSLYVI